MLSKIVKEFLLNDEYKGDAVKGRRILFNASENGNINIIIRGIREDGRRMETHRIYTEEYPLTIINGYKESSIEDAIKEWLTMAGYAT